MITDQVVTENKTTRKISFIEVMRRACKKVAPVWPLESFVAVNPYMGFTDQKFESTAQYLAAVGGVQLTLPTSFYIDKIKEGRITREDLTSAIEKTSLDIDMDGFREKLESFDQSEDNLVQISTLMDVATEVSAKDWNRFVTSRVSNWAASYFDNGQATWVAADRDAGIFNSWKNEAEIDRTPELSGLKNFRKNIKALPDDSMEAARKALEILELPNNTLDVYLHGLLLKVGGWAAYVARLDWDSKLNEEEGNSLLEFLAILICWEAALLQSLVKFKLDKKWEKAKKKLSDSRFDVEINNRLTANLILQDAFDMAAQREMISKFKASKKENNTKPKTKAQAVFCIDVRSEVYRRNLEMVDQDIDTLGFAGFFGFPVNYVPIAHREGEAQCPALIKPGPTVLEDVRGSESMSEAEKNRIFRYQVKKIWKSFRSGAVTCFSFVSPLGISYLFKLFSDSFGITRPVSRPDNADLKKKYSQHRTVNLAEGLHEGKKVGIPLKQKVELAKNALNGMSLTEDFANFVLIAGHGSTSVNNPHASGLDCGACGGRSGEANARVAAAVLNDPEVRNLLAEADIFIPKQTIFLAGLHDTTTDEVKILNEFDVPEDRMDELNDLKASLQKAGKASRTERALRLSVNGNIDEAVKARSKDWSQIRPEWGLAGCSAFVVAPRERTRNVDLKGQSFLHNYDWKKDKDFAILESIMTAPLVVTSWINLQYYASTVDNRHFGAGNKTLHNLTAGVGVIEGYAGDLRVGLPMQSVHDGTNFQHEPVKLKVVIEAPVKALNSILEKHKAVRDLFDNGWMHLMAMDEKGEISQEYAGNLEWEGV